MKIGINALFFQHPASGTGQYLSHLLNALAEIDQENKYLLLGSQPDPKLTGPMERFQYLGKPAPLPGKRSENIEKLIWEQTTGPTLAKQSGVDLYHVPYFGSPLRPRTPTLVTIHDMIPLRLPLYGAGTKVKLYNGLVSRAARQADLVITISQHAKKDIIETLHIAPERIRVIYQAAGEEYRPITDPERLAAVRARYGLGERYVLYLGGLDQRKNVPHLVRAFAHLYKQLGDPDLRLMIAGNPDKQKGPLFPDPRPVAEELGISEKITYRFIEEEDKPALYSATSLFIFPSLYEGFGLTPLEAMSCGAPVVCSNRTSLPEVVGDATISVDPDDTQALIDAMSRVLTNPALQVDLKQRSLKRATHFSWQQTATETLTAYQEVYSWSKK